MRIKKSYYREKMLLERLPDGSDEKIMLTSKIRKYHNECGCSMGAKFLVAAMVLAVCYLIISNGGGGDRLWKWLSGLLFIFLSAVAGKLTGIGIAKWKLNILLRTAYKKLYEY